MQAKRLEVRLNEKESAHYFSNAAALYVLGVGFGVFAAKAHGAFTAGVCFWFSVFLICDCFRLARACHRMGKTHNLAFAADGEGFTHFISWLNPEHVSWKDVRSFRAVKTPQSETVYFQLAAPKGNIFRYALFGAPKFDLPLSCVPGGKAGLLEALESFPEARHLVPARATALEHKPAA